MCVISPEFRGFRILSAYVRITLRHGAMLSAIRACWGRGGASTLVYRSSLMRPVSVDFDQAAFYGLERLKTSEIKLKPEKVKAIRHIYGGKDIVVSSLPALARVSERRELSTEVAA